MTITDRTRNAVCGTLYMDFRSRLGYPVHGRFSFEGVLLFGRHLALVTDRIEGPVSVPGLYLARRQQGGLFEGTWRVPRHNQEGTFRLRWARR
jgi:hypothetical protein